MRINEIAYTCYPVTNLKVSRDFYENVLGLKPTSTFEQGDLGFIEYDIGSSTFAIGAGAESFKVSSEGACVAFEVENFDESVKKLKDNNVKFVLEPHETPVCWMALFCDPDGSKLMIHKRK